MSVWIAEEKPTGFVSTKYDINIMNWDNVDAQNRKFYKYFYMKTLFCQNSPKGDFNFKFLTDGSNNIENIWVRNSP